MLSESSKYISKGEYLDKDGSINILKVVYCFHFLKGVPSAVLIYRTNDSTVFWEKINQTTKRHFVCEKSMYMF